jgi:predicted nucleic acid-binding protein
MTAHEAAVVDTSVIAAVRLYDPSELPDTILITAVTLGELSFGPHATDDPVKRAGRVAVLQHVEATFDPLPYDRGAARLYGQICSAVRVAGREPRRRASDLMIVRPQGAGRRVRPGSPVAALVLVGLVLVLAVVTVPLAGLADKSLNASNGAVWVAAAGAVVGSVLAWRQPGNPVGWIILGGAAFIALSEDGGFYAVAGYRLHHGGLPPGWVALVAQLGWAPWLVLLGLTVLLFPDGRPPSRRWRWVLWVYAGSGLVWIAWTVAITVGAIIGHHTQADSSGELQLLSGSDPAAGWWNAMQVVFIVLEGLCLAASLAGPVASWRRSSGERRQHLKWLAAGSAALVAGAAISGIGTIGTALFLAGFFALPLCIGVAVLKYRLFDIDRVISRTLAYAIVTGLLVGVYAGIVLLATEVLGFHRSTVAVAVPTLAAAALFNPLRRRVQTIADRRFNRARYDADRIIAAFAARLQDAVDLDEVQADLASSVQQVLEPAHVSVWIQAGRQQ